MMSQPRAQYLVIVALLASSGLVHARKRLHVAVAYNMGIPIVSATGKAGDTFSPLGVGLDLGLYLTPRWRVGATFGYQHFSGEGSGPSDFYGTPVEGTLQQLANAAPFLAGGHYFFEAKPTYLKPSVGLYLGGFFVHQIMQADGLRLEESHLHFGFAPEVGMGFYFGWFRPSLLFRYNHAFSSGGSGTISYVTIGISHAWEG